MSIWSQRLIQRLRPPVLFFDALGLGCFAFAGAHKAMVMTHYVEVAIVRGVATAVGGGVMRDVLLSGVPVILQGEIHALAARIGACVRPGQVRADSLCVDAAPLESACLRQIVMRCATPCLAVAITRCLAYTVSLHGPAPRRRRRVR